MEKNIEGFLNELNERYYIQNILVPILDGFTLIPNNSLGIFAAISKDKYMEQFLCDGILQDNENFEDHLNKVIVDVKSSMRDAGFEDVDNNVKFLKTFNNGLFEFKIYTQDLVKGEKILRQYNAYFLDPESKAFYQISLTTCPYSINDKFIVETSITSNMDKTMKDLMKKVRYRKK